MKKTLLWIGAAVLFLNTFAAPTLVRADGVGGTNCSACKPLLAR